jgi:FtsZ-binding cell division protein ZapB
LQIELSEAASKNHSLETQKVALQTQNNTLQTQNNTLQAQVNQFFAAAATNASNMDSGNAKVIKKLRAVLKQEDKVIAEMKDGIPNTVIVNQSLQADNDKL